ncbi:MAG: hypothetical protein KF752_11325 [Pirellulaceae bacterium]|nr:hypothetical protein [Pirellulaceae bacterium]
MRDVNKASRLRLVPLVLLGWSLLACESGCARWHAQPSVDSAIGLPVPKPSPDSLDIETVLMRFEDHQVAQMQEIWLSVDETIIDLEQRLRLDANGVRVGVLRSELPAEINRRLSQASSQRHLDALERAGLASETPHGMRLLRCRAGRRKEVVLRQVAGEPMSVLTSIDGQLAGVTFGDRPTALFALTTFPLNNGQADIELIPEVHHGEPRSTFVTTDSGVRQESRREIKAWKPLKIRTRMAPGNVLIIAATQPPKSLGQAFFVSRTAKQTDEHVLLLVRLAATQMDDLFGSQEVNLARQFMEH